MKGRELRAEARIAVREKGSLSAGSVNIGDAWFPCVVQEMSDNGFRILCGKDLSVGQVLEFRCELFPEKTLNCKIEIRHINPAGMGTKVIEIDKRGTSLVQLYLQEQYSLKLNSKS
jgi:PilZ domain-containing protein